MVSDNFPRIPAGRGDRCATAKRGERAEFSQQKELRNSTDSRILAAEQEKILSNLVAKNTEQAYVG